MKWISIKEVEIEGLYLFKTKSDLYGNSFMTYVKKINNEWCMNITNNVEKYPNIRQRIDCKGNVGALLFGPIPKP